MIPESYTLTEPAGERNYEIEMAVWIWPVSYYVIWKPAGRVLGQILAIYRNWAGLAVS